MEEKVAGVIGPQMQFRGWALRSKVALKVKVAVRAAVKVAFKVAFKVAVAVAVTNTVTIKNRVIKVTRAFVAPAGQCSVLYTTDS